MSNCDLLPSFLYVCKERDICAAYEAISGRPMLGLRVVVLCFLDSSYDQYISTLHSMLFGQHEASFILFKYHCLLTY